MAYKWDIKQIRKNKKYIERRLKNPMLDEDEKEKLRLGLITNVSLLCTSDSLFYTRFGYAINELLTKKFSICKERKYAQMESDMFLKSNDYVDENYIDFLFNLAQNLSREINDENEIEFEKNDLSEDDVINISRNFYYSLGDEEIYNYAMRTLSDEGSINFQEKDITGYEDAKGLNLNDPVFGKSYCIVPNFHNLYSVQALNHEIMHTIDFYECPKVPSKNYYGFHEIPTYTIDYLFIDYLEKIGFDKEEIEKLKNKKFSYLQDLARITILQMKTDIARKKGLNAMKQMSAQDMLECLDFQTMKNLLELESGVIAYGLQKQIMVNKELGLENLKQLMKQPLSKDKKPDFSNIGLSDEMLLELSSELGAYSRTIVCSETIGKAKL